MKKDKAYTYNIKLDDIKDKTICPEIEKQWDAARATMMRRTAWFELFGKVAHNQSLFTNKKDWFSEGSTQAIMRKITNFTIQRVPDGELITQYDKNTWEQAFLEWVFNNKVLYSEWDGRSMFANLVRSFKSAFKYSFACVYTGLEKDLDGDHRISFNLIPWNDVYPDPDCDFIEQAESYIVRRYTSRTFLKSLLSLDGELLDSTYNENTVKYLIDHGMSDAGEYRSLPMADNMKGVTNIESIETRTLYRRGDGEFVTYVPKLNAILRTVKNTTPRKDVPLDFLVLEPDNDFPLGIPQILYLMSQQQFADAFQSVAYKELMLGINPPWLAWGNLSKAKIRMEPGAIWNLGTNPNESTLQPVKVESGVLQQYAKILESVRANQLNSLQVMDSTVASDAYAGYSATAQGVQAQQKQTSITQNSYQKPMEEFFSRWANKALQMYVDSMSGEHEVLVDEITRRRFFDCDAEDRIEGDKVRVDFSDLKAGSAQFICRTGSLVENEKDMERRAISEAMAPLPQMIAGMSDGYKPVLEQSIIHMVERLMELSNIDISNQLAAGFEQERMKQGMQAMAQEMRRMQQIQSQQNQAIGAMAGSMPQEQQQQVIQRIQEQPQQEQGMSPEAMESGEPVSEILPSEPPEVSAGLPRVAPDEL